MWEFFVSAAMFRTDFFVCGIAPMGENLVLLSYDLDGMQQEVCIQAGTGNDEPKHGLYIEKLQVQSPAGIVWEFSSPESSFCVDLLGAVPPLCYQSGV